MEEMTIEEAKEIIRSLMDSMETLFLLAAAQNFILKFNVDDWEGQVARIQGLLASPLGEVFLPLREILAGSSAVRRSEIDWHQIVRDLIESVDDADLE